MRPDLEQRLAAMPRRLRVRHGDDARRLALMLAPDERVSAVAAGPLLGQGNVLVAVTDRRIVGTGKAWSTSVPYGQLSGVVADRRLARPSTVTIHAAGRVLALRSPRHAAEVFVAAVRHAAGLPDPV
ncbi:hypothetical protein LX15_001629 [Streptoalloteichus tenebrarius]|uniref:YokE-like PH domain-containing protein n=1 Tax=Streptoalloteichus tenebrarius (strain ATCC 17920 / DSM 40477 / JCM 4838 / CBS 697.72 / NBRC 16177 / NCIMB 11028 / NRRL B-12390 / A12253. 1 / ISP 5477) TaxID=1933 RepID=A0ABT1HR08_STRSD|nr:hypothetical protein [Streptoalloteichus tenebrarius]MCP2257942.1 hypothetical protein [Streptoalloteichus tenebrarius]BFF01605.1 hypothetical protein GCM10020241_32800 [Streptoalloteichus tenebrarius]